MEGKVGKCTCVHGWKVKGGDRKRDLPGEDRGSAFGRSSVVVCWGEIEVQTNGAVAVVHVVRPSFARWMGLRMFQLQSCVFINRCFVFHGAIRVTYGCELEKRFMR